MKTLEELTNLGYAGGISDLLPKVILAEVEEAARSARFGRNFVQINTDLVRTKGRSIVIGRRGTLTASAATEGQDLSSSTLNLNYTSNTISPSKIGVPVAITQEAIDGANLDLIRDNITEAGIALAQKEDQDIINTLLGKTTFSLAFTIASTFHTGETVVLTAAHSPILISPTAVTVAGTLYTVAGCDYYDGKIGFVALGEIAAVGGTVSATGYYSTNTYFHDSIGKGTLAYEDLIAGLGKIRAQKWTPDFVLIHPNEVNDILKSSAFRDASQYGTPDVLLKGELGMISGVKILVSTNMIEGAALYIASKRAAWMAIKRNVDMKRWDNPRSDSIELYFYMEYGLAITDQTAVCVSVNHMKTTPAAAAY